MVVSSNISEIGLFFFFPYHCFPICLGWATLGWEAYEGFVTLCFLLSLESKCSLPLCKLWAEDQKRQSWLHWNNFFLKKSLLNIKTIFSSFQDLFIYF